MKSLRRWIPRGHGNHKDREAEEHPPKEARRSRRAPREDDDYQDSEAEDHPPMKMRRTGEPATTDATASVPNSRRSGRLGKAAHDKEVARQKAEADNLAVHLLQLPGEIRNTIYELCLEAKPVEMRHDTLVPDGPFEDVAPGRALTQVCRQVRAEFLLVYKRTTAISVPVEDLNEYISTWLHEPASGVLIIDPTRYDAKRRGPGSMMGTKGTLSVDMMPLYLMHAANPKFRFIVGAFSDASEELLLYGLTLKHARQAQIDMVEIKLEVHKWHTYELACRLAPDYDKDYWRGEFCGVDSDGYHRIPIWFSRMGCAAYDALWAEECVVERPY